jgi:hypothetical protein
LQKFLLSFIFPEVCFILIFLIETDGKAGMAVVLEDSPTSIDMNTLAKDLKKHGLPPYARPCFIRLTKHIELTS